MYADTTCFNNSVASSQVKSEPETVDLAKAQRASEMLDGGVSASTMIHEEREKERDREREREILDVYKHLSWALTMAPLAPSGTSL